MRIAFVSQEYPPETAHGGIATQTFAKAQGLAALGHEVHVIAHGIDERRSERRDGDVAVIRIPGFDVRMPINTDLARWITYSGLVAAEVAALHARTGLDVVDFPEWACEGLVHLLNRTSRERPRASVHLQGPLVMLAHTIGWPERDSDLYRIGTMLEGACVRLADAVLSSSRCSARWCARHYGLDEASVEVIHAGVDTALFVPGRTDPTAAPTVLFAGRVAASKGVGTLVEAFCRIADGFPGVRLRIVGQAEDAFVSRLRAQARALGLEQQLEFTGFVRHDDLPREFARADVFAAPSRYEGGPGFVYLEAMSCGLPVIACSGSGAAEVVDDGRSGVLVPPDDAEALAEALRGLLADPARRQAMGEQGRRYAVSEADSRTCARRFEAFYRTLCEREA